jgi:hypothetical protein
MQRKPRNPADDLNRWTFGETPGFWTIVGTRGVGRLAEMRVHPPGWADSRDDLGVRVSLIFSEERYVVNDATLVVGLKKAHINISSEQFRPAHAWHNSPNVHRVPYGWAISGPLRMNGYLEGIALDYEPLVVLQSVDDGDAEAAVTLTADPSDIVIQDVIRGSISGMSSNSSRMRRSIAGILIGNRLPRNEDGRLILAKTRIARKLRSYNLLLQSLVIPRGRSPVRQRAGSCAA